MLELSSYHPLELTVDQRKSLRSMMSEAFIALSRAAKEKYGFRKILQLRNDYRKNRDALWFDPRAKTHLDRMIAAEDTILRGYIRLGAKLCSQFDRRHDRPGVSLGDYLQQCADAVFAAQYGYNGSTKFSTYVTWVMKNRIVSFVRKEAQQARIKNAMLANLRVDGEPQTSDNDCADQFIYHEDLEAMRRIVSEANLSEIQRKLVEDYLEGIKGFQTNLAETLVNPNTGNLYSKQALSNHFIEAREIIRQAYQKIAA